MKIIGNFIVGGVTGAAEAVPIVGPLVVTPTRLSIQAAGFIAQAALSLLAASAAIVTVGCVLVTASIKLISSTSSGIYHLFASSNKSVQSETSKNS